jgi:hypothetical protein
MGNVQLNPNIRWNGTPCWLWRGHVNAHTGYGAMSWGGRRRQAHRLSYELFVRILPAELVCDHLCRRRRCVNFAHLEPVPDKVNILRGECPAAKNAKKTHCKNGHEFTTENTRNIRRGKYTGRACRQCERDRGRASHARLMSLPQEHPRREKFREYHREAKSKYYRGLPPDSPQRQRERDKQRIRSVEQRRSLTLERREVQNEKRRARYLSLPPDELERRRKRDRERGRQRRASRKSMTALAPQAA